MRRAQSRVGCLAAADSQPPGFARWWLPPSSSRRRDWAHACLLPAAQDSAVPSGRSGRYADGGCDSPGGARGAGVAAAIGRLRRLLP